MVEVHRTRRFTKKLSTGLIIAVGVCHSCGRGESDSKARRSEEKSKTFVPSSSIAESEPKQDSPSSGKPVELAEEKLSSTTGQIALNGTELKKWLNEVQPIGVTVCDQFLLSYRRCIQDHGPSLGVNEQILTLQEQVEAWRTMIAGKPKSAKIIEVGCQAAKASAQHTTSEWGCVWK